MGALPKYLLSLVIFLLAGSAQLSAHAPSSKKDSNGPEICDGGGNEAFFISRTSHKEQQRPVFNVLIESESENELFSFKRRLQSSHHYSINVCFGKTTPRDGFRHTKTALLNQYFSSDRCLLIRVFRI